MRTQKQTPYRIAALLLLLGFIFNSISVSAASNKVLVTDSNGDGKVSIGDEFCLGTECFNIMGNEDGELLALAKYNLYVGANYSKVVLDINKTYIKCPKMDNGDLDRGDSAEYYYDGAKVASHDEWIAKLAEEFNLEKDGDRYYLNGATDILGDEYTENGVKYQNLTYKFYPYESITDSTVGFARQNKLARGVTGEKGNANYPIYATVRFDPFTSFSGYRLYKKGYVNVGFDSRSAELAYLDNYLGHLNNSGFEVSDIDMPNITDIDNLVHDVKGSELPLEAWYNAASGETNQEDELGKYGELGDLKSILSDDYSWLWNTTFWLKTLASEDDNISYHNNPTMYFVSSAGDICYSDSCNTAIPRAGIRPLIFMASDQFELNRMDINGTVRWVDNNNSSKIRPNKSIIKLYRNGVMIDSVEVTKDEEEDLWRFAFKNLLKYDASGNLYKYTITQDDVAQYASDITNFDVVNEYTPSTTKNPKTSAMNPGIYAGIIAIFGAGTYLVMRKGRR